MIILAITNHHESSAAIFKNGKVFAVSEERFTRSKNQPGIPVNSINWLLKKSETLITEVDHLYYCSISSIEPSEHMLDIFYDDLLTTRNFYNKNIKLARMSAEILYNKVIFQDFKQWLLKENIPDNKVSYMDHHEAHARSAINFYGLSNSRIFTCDGKGGFTSSAVWDYTEDKENDLINVSRGLSHDSIGYFYGNVTLAAGFMAERHEGKITGLAAFTNPPPNFNLINPFQIIDGKIKVEKFQGIYMPFFDRNEETYWDLSEFNAIVKSWTREELASAAQVILEQTILNWISCNLPTHSDNICLSGGVFANVKLNQKVREAFPNFNVYVSPTMSDLGLVLGVPLDKNPRICENQGLYLGPDFVDNEIIDELRSNALDFEEINSTETMVEKVIELFNSESPIGIFNGSMEFGPRALCNRSVIFHAKNKKVNEILNLRLSRSEFMPFAPVVPDFLAEKSFVDYKEKDFSSRYMTTTYKCTQYFSELSPAVVHVDGTARPQILHARENRLFYEFISKYFEITGEPCLINTSFNNHEEPIVCSPKDAIQSLYKGNIDAIIFNNKYLVKRKGV